MYVWSTEELYWETGAIFLDKLQKPTKAFLWSFWNLTISLSLFLSFCVCICVSVCEPFDPPPLKQTFGLK